MNTLRLILKEKIVFSFFLVLFLVMSGFSQVKSEAISFTTADNVLIKGHYFKGKKNKPAILMMHQCNQDQNSYNNLVQLLSKEGFNILTFDFRGFGESKSEKYFDFNKQFQEITESLKYDAEAAYQFLVSQPKINKNVIGTIGASCGAEESVVLAQNHPEIKTMVLLSGSFVPFPKEKFKPFWENPDDPKFAEYKKSKEFVEKSNAVTMLGVADDEDYPDIVLDSMKEFFVLAPNKENLFLVYKGKEHGTKIFSQEKDLESKIVQWFKVKLL